MAVAMARRYLGPLSWQRQLAVAVAMAPADQPNELRLDGCGTCIVGRANGAARERLGSLYSLVLTIIYVVQLSVYDLSTQYRTLLST